MRRVMRRFGWLWLLWLLPLQAAPQFPTLSGRVVDEAALLSPAEKDQLEQRLAAHEKESTNQVVVVTLASLQGYAIEEYGYQLGRHWGIGQQGKDNGVLLIIAPAERKVRIEVGYGLEGQLTDATSHNIIQTVILPAFKQGRMAQGVVAGTGAILAALGGSDEPQAAVNGGSGESEPLKIDNFGTTLIIAFIGGSLAGLFFGNRLITALASAAIALLVGIIISTLQGAFFAALLVFIFQLGGVRGGGGGGGSTGGGFSGGGGSFGGGGASGSW